MTLQVPPSPEPQGAPPRFWQGLWGRVHRWGIRNPKHYYVTPPSVWAVMIYVSGMIRAPEIESPLGWELPGFDKLIHFVLYAVLALLLVRGWQREKMPPIDLHIFVWGLCFVFGLMIEITQGLLSYRSFEALDLAANAAGAAGGLVAWHLIMVRFGKRTRLYPGLLRAGPLGLGDPRKVRRAEPARGSKREEP